MFKLKRFKLKNFLILLLVSSKAFANDDKGLVDLNEIFSKKEINFMDKNPDKFYVYLSKDFVNYLNNLKITKDTPEELALMKEHVKNYKSAEYDFTLDVVEKALKECKDSKDLDILNSYKMELKSGDAVLNISSKQKGHCNKKKCLCRLIVKERADLGSLEVMRDAKVDGNLTVVGTINGVQFPITKEKSLTLTDLTVTNNTRLNNLTATGTTSLSSLTTTGLTTTGVTSLSSSTTIGGKNPVLDPSESVSLLRAIFTFPTTTFSVKATGTTTGITYSINSGSYSQIAPVPVSEVTRTGAGIKISSASFQAGTDASGTAGYTNTIDSSSPNEGSDFIYIPLAMTFTFDKSFNSAPAISASLQDAPTATVYSAFDSSKPGSGATLTQVLLAVANVTKTEFTLYLNFGFTVNTFVSSSSTETPILSGINDIMNSILTKLSIDVTAIG